MSAHDGLGAHHAKGEDERALVLVEHAGIGPGKTEDAPQKVLVPETSLESAQHAIEALTEPDGLVSET